MIYTKDSRGLSKVIRMKTDNRKIKILFYSDCPFFAGCENMLACLFNNPNIHQEFDITFAYRYSKEYEDGLHSRLKLKINEIPLKLPADNLLFNIINKIKVGFVNKLLKAIVIGSCLKYLFSLYNVFRLLFVFRKVRPDILHINNGGYPGAYSCISAVFAAKMARIKKVVFVVNNIITPYDNFLRYIEKPIDKFVKNNTTVFVTASKYAGNKLRDLWNLPQQRVINLPNTVMLRPMVEPRESVLKRLGITNNHIILGNIALLEPRKGQRYLIKALAIVREKLDNFENVILIIEGTGKEREYLRSLVADLRLGKNVVFLENEKNIFDIINILDVFILPSIEYEDFPNVILEAMSLWKPVIGTELAGIPEQIENGVNGFIVAPRDIDALSEAMLILIKDRNKRNKMGEKSLERFNRLFSYDKVISNYIRLYKEFGKCNE